ncbi:MAG: hypothetical protein LBV11_05420, partial [Bacillus cereus]|jgi:hypothetical protein|nr:hypothetical protein [Bacillus cereus]
MLSLKRAINTDDRTEIERRKTHGIYSIKQIAIPLKITTYLDDEVTSNDDKIKLLNFHIILKFESDGN